MKLSKPILFGSLLLGGAAVAATIRSYRMAMAEAEDAWHAIAERSAVTAETFSHASIAALSGIARRYFTHANLLGLHSALRSDGPSRIPDLTLGNRGCFRHLHDYSPMARMGHLENVHRLEGMNFAGRLAINLRHTVKSRGRSRFRDR